MCATCGCGSTDATLTPLTHAHPHEHEHAHGGDHHHDHAHHPPHEHVHAEPRRVELEQEVLHKNIRAAQANRARFLDQGVVALNLVSAPGSGKTTLLERTIPRLASEVAISVIEGDQSTLLDAERIRATGAPVVQVNTDRGCHLDAEMVARAAGQLAMPRRSLLLVENVGNLVCPALFDLGEHERLVILSVTEGDDKPLKYPHIFRSASLMLINKIDLLPHVQFDLERTRAHAKRLNPRIEVLPISATRGDGMDAWVGWLRERLPA